MIPSLSESTPSDSLCSFHSSAQPDARASLTINAYGERLVDPFYTSFSLS